MKGEKPKQLRLLSRIRNISLRGLAVPNGNQRQRYAAIETATRSGKEAYREAANG
jgi:hypothetical protein